MLVLSRKVGERIVISENIKLVVVSVRGGKVRLAVDAPRDVAVRRAEAEPQKPSQSFLRRPA